MDFITKRISVNDIELPDKVYKTLEEYGIKRKDAQLIRKGIVPEKDSKFEENKKGEKTSIDYITTKTRDRDGEIVLPKGGILTDYQKNPVVLFGHDYKSIPIGMSVWIKSDEKGLISKTKYANHAKADEIFNYRRDGFPMAKSIGFVPLEVVEEKDFGSLDLKSMDLTKKDIEGAKRIYPKWLMLEYSDVPVPSNPDALQLAISKGLFTIDEAKEMAENAFVIEIEDGKDEDIILITDAKVMAEAVNPKRKIRKEDDSERVDIEKPYPNEHACRLKPPSKFIADSFRRTTRDHEGKQYSIIMGKLTGETTMTEQAYRYNKDTWDAASAGTHCKDHGGTFEVASPEKEMLKERYNLGKNKEEEIELELVDEEKEINDEGMIVEEKEEKEIVNEIENKLAEIKKEFVDGEIGYLEKSADGKFTRWNKSLPKSFDVETVELRPSTAVYDIVGKYLECKTKDIFQNPFFISGTLIGCYLSAFKEITEEFDLDDIRNFTHSGTESPPVYEVIQLNSKLKDDFLISGMSFYKVGKDPSLVTKIEPSWGGMELTLFTKREQKDFNIGVIDKAKIWVKENNFLKGERFALSGEFLEKGKDDWSDLFLTSKNELAIRRTVDLINKKGNDLANRGILDMGPPGTGKTLSGRVIMNNINDATFIWISARDFYRSGAASGLSFAFKLARDLAPTVLFVEDIDNWLGVRTVDLLKTEMDGLKQTKGIVTILTSNYPEMLPDALIDRPGRFHDILNFDLPDPIVREKMIRNWAQGISNKMLRPVINATKGFSGAHIFELISFAKTLVEEDGLDLDEAIRRSFEKLTEQRELITQIRGDKKKEIEDGIITINEEREILGRKILEIDNDEVLKDFEFDEDEDDPGEIKAIEDEMIEKCSYCGKETEEKAGRVISTKNRKIIVTAVTGMKDAITALDILMEATNPDKEEIPAEDVSKEKELELPEVSDDKIELDIDNFKDILKNVVELGMRSNRIDVDKVVNEQVGLAKGKIL